MGGVSRLWYHPPAVMTRSPSSRLLQALNVALLGAMYVALLTRAGHFSVSYRAALGAGGVVLGFAVLSLLGRDLLGACIRQPRFARPAVRALFAIGPWVGLAAGVVVTGLWWNQRPPALRLFATYTLAIWSIAWLAALPGRADTPAPAGELRPEAPSDRFARNLLITFALALALLGIDGLALGITPFGAALSALLVCCASSLGAIAVLGGRTARGNVVAVCFGLVFGLACAEIGIRVLHLGDSLLEVDTLEYARQFHHITPPGSAFVNRPKPLDEFPPALIEINSLGVRGPEIPAGPVDLLLLGDSMIEARQLTWEQTLGPRLQATLLARSAPVRVVAHGVRGWSPLLEWNWYLKVGRRLHPRTVLLFFFWNDLWPSGDEVHTFDAVLRPDGRPDHFEVVVEPDWVWYKHVRAVRLAEDVLHRAGLQAIRRMFSMIGGGKGGTDLAGAQDLARRMAAGPPLTPGEMESLLTQPRSRLNAKLREIADGMFWPGIRPLNLWTGQEREAAEKAGLELQRFAEDVASDGGRLVVVYVPNAYQISPSECSVSRYLDGLDDDVVLPPDSGIQAWLRGVAERHHIELLDPSDTMRAFDRAQPPGAPPLYLRADCHWSVRGHQFMADYLADWYLRSQAAGRQ